MKKLEMFLLCSVMVAAFALMEGKGCAAEKTGFIHIREVVNSSDAGKKAAEELNKLYEKSGKVIQEKEAELKKLKDELEKQRSILTESALKEKDSVYQKKLRDFQLLVKDSREDLQNRDQELANTIIPEIMKVVSAIGEKEKFTLILDTSTIPIAYYSKENDLTKRVIEEFNKSYKPKK